MKEKLLEFINTNFESRSFNTILNSLKISLKKLLEDGELEFDNDYELGGELLEFRINLLFEKIGFNIDSGRPNLEDFIIFPLDEFETKKPIVIEVKSGNSKSFKREHLRQLDDWVFELSGEEKARKVGLNSGTSLITRGLGSTKAIHPNPHKGLFIYNGPINKVFNEREPDWIGHNELEFAKKRNFCIASFPNILKEFELIIKNKSQKKDLWEKIHTTCGELL